MPQPIPESIPELIPERWVVISLAGLATAALQPYGCSWNATPGFNCLASQSVVWDRVIATHDDDTAVLQACWQPSAAAASWLQACQSRGRSELLLAAGAASDRLPPLADQAGFDRCTVVDIATSADTAVETVEETALAQLVAVLLDRLDDAGDPCSLLWLHSDFLTRYWDAPRWLFPIEDDADEGRMDGDETFMDADENAVGQGAADSLGADTPPPMMSQTQPPGYPIAAGDDPDWVMTWMQTYGCQVRLVDELLTVIRQRLQRSGEPVGLMVLATSGMSLGQNGWIGHRVGPLRSPQIQLPVFVHFGNDVPTRIAAVTSLPELFRRLVPGQPLPSAEAWSQWSDAMVATESHRAAAAVTTRNWYYVQPPAPAAGDDAPTEQAVAAALYLKPDDRDDVNDVASRCPAEVAEFEV